MKKMNFWLLASLFAGALAFTACSSHDDDAPSSNDVATPVDPTTMKMSALSGFVYDKDGKPLPNVEISTGTLTTKTDASGGFSFSSVGTTKANGASRTVLTFKKDGYFKVTRAAELTDGDIWEVVMRSTYNDADATSTTIDPSYEGSVNVRSMKVNFQQDGFKDKNNNLFYGSVTTDMLYLDPDDEDFAASMPGGDLAATNKNGEAVQLVSWGMTLVDMTDDSGNSLQLADGKPATMTYPVPEKFKNGTKPATIPLWSFDEKTGLWIEEGIATYDSQLDAYVGPVTHFSWANLDYPEKRTMLTVIVQDAAGNRIPHVKVDIDGQKSFFTNNSGEGKTYVPRNTDFYVTVHSEDYANYTGEKKVEVPAISGETSTVTITLPTVGHISGRVLNQGSGNNVATIWIEYKDPQTNKTAKTKSTHSDMEGKFYLMAPAGFTGTAKLKVRGGDGKVKIVEINLVDGQSLAINVDFNSDVSEGGAASITYNGTTKTLTFEPVEIENGGGVCIIDGFLSATNGWPMEFDFENQSWANMNLFLEGYNPSQTKYTDKFSISVMKEGHGDGDDYHFSVEVEEGEVNITPLGNNKYRIQANGTSYLQGWQYENEGGDPIIAQAMLDITMPLYAKGTSKTNVKESDNLFPSFTPWLTNVAADDAVVITESPALGKGGFLSYRNTDLTRDNFNSMVDKAKQTLGEPVDGYMWVNQYQDNGYYVFLKGNKFLRLSWNGKWSGGNSNNRVIEMNSLEYGYDGRITVIAYDGYTFTDKWGNNGRK